MRDLLKLGLKKDRKKIIESSEGKKSIIETLVIEDIKLIFGIILTIDQTCVSKRDKNHFIIEEVGYFKGNKRISVTRNGFLSSSIEIFNVNENPIIKLVYLDKSFAELTDIYIYNGKDSIIEKKYDFQADDTRVLSKINYYYKETKYRVDIFKKEKLKSLKFYKHTVSLEHEEIGNNKVIDHNISDFIEFCVDPSSTKFNYENAIMGMTSVQIADIMVKTDYVKFNANNKGHGFAGEQANHLLDKLTFKDATIVGSDNKKNGPDRIVEGIEIQTKYCASASKSISECFENSQFKYYNSEGKPMIVEVPKDQYESAIQAMEERIKKGQINGVSDPAEAKKLVKKGKITLEQAKKIAKAGTIEGVTFDAINGIKVAGGAMGLSALVTFAASLWNGEDVESALELSVKQSLITGGESWATFILTQQIARTSLENSLRPATDYVTKELIGSKGAAKLSKIISGKTIHGAAATNHLSKLMRGNVVAAAITTAILSANDVTNLIRGHISGSQAFKNILEKGVGVLGGLGGFVAGAAAGAKSGVLIGSATPIPGATVGGGIIGGVVSGVLASKGSKVVLDKIIDDDSVALIPIIEDEFIDLAQIYLLNKSEIIMTTELLMKVDYGTTLKEMFGCKDYSNFARNMIESLILDVISTRNKIRNPSIEEVSETLFHLLENETDGNTDDELDIIKEVESDLGSDFGCLKTLVLTWSAALTLLKMKLESDFTISSLLLPEGELKEFAPPLC